MRDRIAKAIPNRIQAKIGFKIRNKTLETICKNEVNSSHNSNLGYKSTNFPKIKPVTVIVIIIMDEIYPAFIVEYFQYCDKNATITTSFKVETIVKIKIELHEYQ